MSAPVLAPLTELLRHPGLRLPPVPPVADGVRLFVVVQAGFYAGLRWYRGDVVACDETSGDGGPLILEARGMGRPRLGHRSGSVLYGDGGEACHPARWRVAGRAVALLQPDDGRRLDAPAEGERLAQGWRVTALGMVSQGVSSSGVTPPAPGGGGGVAPLRVARLPANQLGLFGSRRAA